MAGINNCINNTANVFSSTTTITAGTGIGCTLNDITATAGNLVTTTGNAYLGNTAVSTTASDVSFKKSRTGGVITSGDALGQINFSGHDGVGYINGARITSTNSGTVGADRVAGDLKFYTHPDNNSSPNPTLRLTIASTGAITIAAPDAGTALTITNGGLTVTAGTVAFSALSWGTACFNATGEISSQAPGVAGQVLTSNGAAALPTFQAPSGGMLWAAETNATKTIVVNSGYIANRGGGVAFALPATSAVGTTFAIAGQLGLWSITQAANQYILFGNTATTTGVAGSLTATNAQDCLFAVCIEADKGWVVTSSVGNLTLA